ncbi:hypothetical protein [Chryseobacterium luquanense]|uniref:Peptidase S12 Pab87-related C-terminal domain-containing protein n=1 Tax=Chryseobacterium luquanense TaxID=2983766 RepID=A0ABT3Y2N8_9FLAO|nr:hypothetical protein [Chryseobacterium luquanense]MCX8532408.1 hypothetical protein [Chryseobacterium luquanense]
MVVAHSGSWSGYLTYIERNLSKDHTIILLQNIETSKSSFSLSIVRKILNNEKIISTNFKKFTYTSADLEFSGVYSSEKFPIKITITKENNTLFAQGEGQGKFATESFENNLFTFDQAGLRLTFNPEKSEMFFEQGKNKITFKKE